MHFTWTRTGPRSTEPDNRVTPDIGSECEWSGGPGSLSSYQLAASASFELSFESAEQQNHRASHGPA